ncbi:MAG: hypothetical protein ACYCWE_18470 [Eubacteriales bacterium]
MKRKLLEYEEQADSFTAVQSFIKDRKLKLQDNNIEININIKIKSKETDNIYNTNIIIDCYDKFTYENCSKYTIKIDNIPKDEFKYDYIDTNYDKIKYDETSDKVEDRSLKFKVGNKKYILK